MANSNLRLGLEVSWKAVLQCRISQAVSFKKETLLMEFAFSARQWGKLLIVVVARRMFAVNDLQREGAWIEAQSSICCENNYRAEIDLQCLFCEKEVLRKRTGYHLFRFQSQFLNTVKAGKGALSSPCPDVATVLHLRMCLALIQVEDCVTSEIPF